MAEAKGHIVKSMQVGRTTIHIADDYCKDRTKEEVDVILKRIARNSFSALSAASENG